MTEDKLRDATVRANRAKSLLDDDLLKEAFDVTTRSYLDAWMATGLSEQDKRERLWHAVQTVAKVRAHLVTVLNGGKLAQAEIDMLVADQARKRRFGII
jgi:hypothetical protein